MSSTPIKHEFASPGWFTALHAMLHQAVNAAGDLAGVRWSTCEVFTNLPSHLPQGRDGSIAWHYYLQDGDILFGFGERDDVRFRAELDYGVACELAVVRVDGDPEKQQFMERKLMAAVRDGKGRIQGSRDERPEQLADFHDAIAAITR